MRSAVETRAAHIASRLKVITAVSGLPIRPGIDTAARDNDVSSRAEKFMNGKVAFSPLPRRLLLSVLQTAFELTDHIVSCLLEFVELLRSFLFQFHSFSMSFTNCILYISLFPSVVLSLLVLPE